MLFVCSACFAQVPSADAGSSVSGTVTIDGKGAEGITVVARIVDSQWQNRTVAKAVTDGEGNYSLMKLPAGHFIITPIAKAFVVENSESFEQPGQSVNVGEKESISKIDFALVHGGVITGRITDIEGRPIIGEQIDIMADNGSGDEYSKTYFLSSKNQTDDRGIYRVYGLGPGNYKVSIGKVVSNNNQTAGFRMGGSQYIKTYYPGVEDSSKATTIEITEGSEVLNIDITPGKTGRGYSVSGRVVDADSNHPVPHVYVAYSTVSEENQTLGGMNLTGGQTDENGKFHLDGVAPGHYAAYTLGLGLDNSYSDPTSFYVSSDDVTGIEIKTRRGATIEGAAIIENNTDPTVAAILQSQSLIAYVSQEHSTSAPSFSYSKINANGSFQFVGLAPGKARIQLTGYPNTPQGLEFVRTEFQGIAQPDGIEVIAGAHVTGVRLVFSYGTGKIRGELKVNGGAWPEDMEFNLTISAVGGSSGYYSRSIEVDSRGHFVVEHIPPGSYTLLLRSVEDGPTFEPVTRTVTVSNGVEVPITISIELTGNKAGR